MASHFVEQLAQRLAPTAVEHDDNRTGADAPLVCAVVAAAEALPRGKRKLAEELRVSSSNWAEMLGQQLKKLRSSEAGTNHRDQLFVSLALPKQEKKKKQQKNTKEDGNDNNVDPDRGENNNAKSDGASSFAEALLALRCDMDWTHPGKSLDQHTKILATTACDETGELLHRLRIARQHEANMRERSDQPSQSSASAISKNLETRTEAAKGAKREGKRRSRKQRQQEEEVETEDTPESAEQKHDEESAATVISLRRNISVLAGHLRQAVALITNRRMIVWQQLRGGGGEKSVHSFSAASLEHLGGLVGAWVAAEAAAVRKRLSYYPEERIRSSSGSAAGCEVSFVSALDVALAHGTPSPTPPVVSQTLGVPAFGCSASFAANLVTTLARLLARSTRIMSPTVSTVTAAAVASFESLLPLGRSADILSLATRALSCAVSRRQRGAGSSSASAAVATAIDSGSQRAAVSGQEFFSGLFSLRAPIVVSLLAACRVLLDVATALAAVAGAGFPALGSASSASSRDIAGAAARAESDMQASLQTFSVPARVTEWLQQSEPSLARRDAAHRSALVWVVALSSVRWQQLSDDAAVAFASSTGEVRDEEGDGVDVVDASEHESATEHGLDADAGLEDGAGDAPLFFFDKGEGLSKATTKLQTFDTEEELERAMTRDLDEVFDTKVLGGSDKGAVDDSENEDDKSSEEESLESDELEESGDD